MYNFMKLVEYALEYGTDVLCVHDDDLKSGMKVAVVDDILATGGTAKAICNMIEIKNAKLACCAFFMELEFLKGRDFLADANVISIIKK
jgi:adenine phosphoribosyltransferase